MEWTIDFGQNLPEDQLNRALVKSNSKTLHLVLGSSLTVSPACTMPKATKKNGIDIEFRIGEYKKKLSI